MDKEYVVWSLTQRLNELHARYRCAVNGCDEKGIPYKNDKVAGVARTTIKRDLNLCQLLLELTSILPNKAFTSLSEDAIVGLERIMEPMERHRRLK